MREFSFELAAETDDAAIRELLRRNPVPGAITVSYEREPDYFIGCGTMGPFCQVAVARHLPTGRIAGLGCRAIRPMYVNGKRKEVGYLGQLRVDEQFRGRWLVSRGMRYFRELHQDGRADGYITTIIEGNDVARGLLVERARSHHPVYREIGRLLGLELMLRRPLRQTSTPYVITRGSRHDLAEIVAFLSTHGPDKNFFPVWEIDDFGDGAATTGFSAEDFCVARLHDDIVGVMGLWDQSGFKQIVVRGYPWHLNAARPAYNLLERVRGGTALPSPGSTFHHVYASFACIRENDPDIFRVLLRHVCNEAGRRGFSHLSLGLEERDPLAAVAKSFPHLSYPARVFSVCWAGEDEFHSQLDDRIQHLEMATF